MKKLFQDIIKKLYWKLNCHTTEPFSHQLVLYAIPAKFRKDTDIVSIVYQIKTNLEKATVEPLASCIHPYGSIKDYETIDLTVDGDKLK